ncbi:MAG: hypothetical protein JJT76_06690 [Clostridiaceae bacterium]|nr:hypothetical protein [Clostridiaceae bacterium]
MTKLFRVTGIVSIGIALIIVLMELSYNPMRALIAGFFGTVNGLAMIALGDVIKDVNYLKEKLNIYLPGEVNKELPQVTCFKCGFRYDFDYPKCPSCGSSESSKT